MSEESVLSVREMELSPTPQPSAAAEVIDQPSVMYIPATNAPVCVMRERERERERESVCERERERERESVCVRERERERDFSKVR